MSICNVSYDADRVLVAVDTASVTAIEDEAPRFFKAQKAMIHGTTLVACRGALGVLRFLNFELIEAFRFWEIDALRAELEPALKRAHARMVSAWASAGRKPSDLLSTCEVTVAGWSDKKKQMRAFVATRQPDGEWLVEMITARCTAPAAPDAVGDDLSSEAAMMAVARKQVAHCKAADPQAAIGGDLVVYEILPAGIIIRQSGAI
jgi:hypothetical protein